MKKQSIKDTNPNPLKELRKKITFLKFASIAIAIIAVGLIVIYMQVLEAIDDSKNETINILKEERFEQIYTYATELRSLAATQSSKVAIDLESDIRETMDIDVLKADLDSNRTNEDLQTILHENAYDKYLNGVENRRNGMFITTRSGVIEDCNYDRAANSISFRDWTYELEHCYNYDLEKDAIDKLLSHSTDLIVTEHVNYLGKSDANYESHRLMASPSKAALKKMYMEEGILGLRNYQFLVPSYITETGDIFGQPEISHGIKNETHTFIVVQEFNLYDQIKAHYPEMMETSNVEEVELRYANILTIMHIIGIGYAVILVALLFLFSAKYNNYVEKHELEQELLDAILD